MYAVSATRIASCSLRLGGRIAFKSDFISASLGLTPPALTKSEIVFSNSAMPIVTPSKVLMALDRRCRILLRIISRRMPRPWSM